MRYFLIILLVIVFNAGLKAQKNDTVYLANGDRITGELKKFESGILRLSTSAMSTLYIEYDKINSLHSSKYFEIVTSRGFSYYGSIVRSALPGHIGIAISNDTVEEPLNTIVEIVQINKKFFQRFYGSFDLGGSYYKATNIFQYYINADINYRSKKNLLSLGVNSIFSDEKSSGKITRKNDGDFRIVHYYKGNLLGCAGVQVQQNTELDLEGRFQFWTAIGYDIVHTNPVRFYSMAGVLVNREKSYDTVDISTNFEGLISLRFVWLQYRDPEISVSTNFDAYPSFTVSNRIRLESDLSVKYEIFNDFFIALTFYDNYDNRPSGGGPALNDWGSALSIGYTF